MSPTQRSLKWLRDRGYHAAVVEKWNAYARIRQDLFGICDIVAIKEDQPGIMGVQTTSGSNVSARITKCMESPSLAIWLKAGNRFVIHGWAKRGARGERKLWDIRIHELGPLN